MNDKTLLNFLKNKGLLLWENAWRTYVYKIYRDHACDLIDLATCELKNGWDRLDLVRHRRSLVPNNAKTWNDCVDALLNVAKPLNDQLASAGLPKLGKGALGKGLFNVVPLLIDSQRSKAILAENPFPSLWNEIAGELAHRLHARNYMGTGDPEWLLLNGLLISGYFVTCKLPEARFIRNVFKELSQKPLGFRGFFVRIPEFISPSGLEDTPVPIFTPVGGTALQHEMFTQMLSTTAAESRQIAAGNGLLHEILPLNSESSVPLHLLGVVTQSQLIQARDAAYRLYEHTILAYLALACIEQLMRTWATNRSVKHMHVSGRPIGVTEWMKDLNPTAALIEDLREIYDPNRSNIRNRVMHGNLLEIEGKLLDTRLPIADAQRFPMNTSDPYLPANISSICLSCLQRVDQEIALNATLEESDLSWTNFFSLSPDEIDFGYHLRVDFLTGEGEEWLNYVTRYLNAIMPALKQPFCIGFIGWMQRPSNDSLPRFMALGLVFESIYRITVHLLGFSILQVSRPNGTKKLKYQYRMLDERPTGLFRDEILNQIVSHVDPNDHLAAKRTLRLALKARNAFSHGAIPSMDEKTADAIGHLFVKSVQTLVSGGLHHMVKQASYFEWQNSLENQHEDCWYRGESEVFDMIRRAAEV